MLPLNPSMPPGQPDPVLVRRLLMVQRALLGVVALITIAALAVWVSNPKDDLLPAVALHMSIPMAVTALICALSLALSETGSSAQLLRLSRLIATLAALIAMAVLLESVFHFSATLGGLLNPGQAARTLGSVPLQPPSAFVFLAVVMILIQQNGRLSRNAADAFAFCLCLLMSILVSENLSGSLGLFGLTSEVVISPPVLGCLVLLTVVVALRQAEHGVFSIFLGHGIGSRIARGFAPILLLMPFLLELGRTQMGFAQLIPPHYSISILVSVAAALSFLLLVFLVWQINGMEKEIHDLTLRDELTALYNLRGFYLLAEQTMHLARRAELPFSVLFLDLDNLKQINDQLGHSTGSAYLVEAAELLNESFREGDVKGRFGGDEFVVAGQFSVVGIQLAAHRLTEAAAERSTTAGRELPLSFSIGHATSEHYSRETLKELVTKADQAMYQIKRGKKLRATRE